LIADVDCTQDSAKKLCEKYGVQGYPTIKYFSKDTSEMGEKYEGDREYNKLKKFVTSNSKPPCVLATLEHCSKKEKAFIEESTSWDEAKVKEELESVKSQIEAAKTKHQDLADLFEKQKDEAMATMKKSEEAKTDLEKVTKGVKYKINIMEQVTKKKDEL